MSIDTQLADMAQLVEHMLGKHEVTSSNLVISSTPLRSCGGVTKKLNPYADMAQLVEHMLGKHEVTSSNLVISSKNVLAIARAFLIFFLKFFQAFRAKGVLYVC